MKKNMDGRDNEHNDQKGCNVSKPINEEIASGNSEN
jgi:hypothetical protein